MQDILDDFKCFSFFALKLLIRQCDKSMNEVRCVDAVHERTHADTFFFQATRHGINAGLRKSSLITV